MRVKVFTAATVQEAMTQVKSELGIDAVILHTKRFHKGGFLGYMGKEMVEVTAAVEDTAKPKRPVKKDVIMPKKAIDTYKKKMIMEPGQEMNIAEPNLLQPAAPAVAASVSGDSTSVVEKEQAERIIELQRELDSMKIMLQKVMEDTSRDKMEIKPLPEILRDNEVQERVVQEILSDIVDDDILRNRNPDKTREALKDYFDKKFHPAEEIKVFENKQKIVALLGTTGVGKTTTIAKLAANFVLEKGCSVALITADTYRISAVEQLKTYSDIIGLPLEIVYAPAELKAALLKHNDKQLILIDTAGRSQYNEFQLDELKTLVNVNSKIEKHLVLSATTKYKDAVEILRKFSICLPDKVLFTKVDETSSVGSIINLLHEYPITLSYITNGQSVPDDIALADSSKLAELILR